MEGGTKRGTLRGDESGLAVTNSTGRRRSRGKIEVRRFSAMAVSQKVVRLQSWSQLCRSCVGLLIWQNAGASSTSSTPGGFAEDTSHNFLQTLALPASHGPGTVTGPSASGILEASYQGSQRRRRSSAATSMAAGVLNNFLQKKPDDQPADPYRLTLCDQIRLTLSSLNATSNFERG
jgi:hypothetical protein